MDRRDFVQACAVGATATSLASALGTSAWAANAQPKAYARTLLVDEQGQPFKASQLRAQVNYVFHYPFEATPVFLLDLGKAAQPATLNTKDKQAYEWPGGVGAKRSVVAFSAICAHKLVYPTKELSFISFRKGAVANPQTPSKGNDLIHCCADHSQYDPARGAQVLTGDSVDAKDCFIAPTLLTNIPRDARIMEEEIFGPLLPIKTYRDFSAAIDYVNARPRPLAAYYFGEDAGERQQVLERTTSGAVVVNDCMSHVLFEQLPFGGVGHSGMGAYHGVYGFRTFSHAKAVVVQSPAGESNLAMRAPYGEAIHGLLDQLLTAR